MFRRAGDAVTVRLPAERVRFACRAGFVPVPRVRAVRDVVDGRSSAAMTRWGASDAGPGPPPLP